MRFRLSKAQRRKAERLLSLFTPFFYPFLYALGFLPHKALWGLAGFLALLWRILPSRRKEIARTNLALFYPPEEGRQILSSAMRHWVAFALDLLKLSQSSPGELKARVRLTGLEVLDGLGGRGAVLVSAHLGNFPLLAFRLASEGFRVGVVIKYPRNPFVARKVRERGERWGVEMIDGSSRARAALKARALLRAGGLLLLMLDQNPRSEAAVVPFLGIPTPTYRSPVVLSRRAEVPVVPAFCLCEGPGRYAVEVLPPLWPSGDLEADLAQLNEVIGERVKRHPEQWWWWHRRWRHLLKYER